MAPRTIKATETETVSALKESTALPISVGNPMPAARLAIDQSHMEEFATAEERSSDVSSDKPPKGIYFTVRPETGQAVEGPCLLFPAGDEGPRSLHRRSRYREAEKRTRT